MPISATSPSCIDQAVDIKAVFDCCFVESWSTCLVGGATEPFYQPAESGQLAQVIFTLDYTASALHEIAHWCIAGPRRLLLADYGYWYAPDGRTAEQQIEFERVEVKPQALEWIFSKAAGREFRVSADNLENELGPSKAFKIAVYKQVLTYLESGLEERPLRFTEALCALTRAGKPLKLDEFLLAELH